jgi:hypothetical protein
MHRIAIDKTPAALGTGAVLIALAALHLGAMAGIARAQSGRHGCFPAHSTTLAATAKVRVFQTRGVARETRVHATYGCLLSRKRPVRFEVPDFPTGYGPIAIAGSYVAYAVYSDCAASFCDPNNVVVQDLRTGKRRFADGPLRVANVTSLVLRANGSAAWIQTSFDEGGSTQPGYSVVKADRGQAPDVLDTGVDIVANSLALAGTTLYWTNGPTPVSAVLG